MIDPIAFTASATQRIVRTNTAFIRPRQAVFDKRLIMLIPHKLLNGIFPDISQFPFIQSIKIAGIDAAVTFNNQISTASA